MKRAILFALILGVVNAGAQSRNTSEALSIYLVDVEGGNATLFVAPSGESVLIDTGNVAPAAARDAERIMAAAKDAGISQINTLITTHWHNDHFGGMAELASRIPIRHFVDHGPNVQPAAAADEFLQKLYPALYAKSTHTVVKPGDRIPIAGLDWRIVSAGSQTIKTPLPGAQRANPFCGGFKPHTVNPVSGLPVGNTEDEQSVGSHITFGRFRAVHLGDLQREQGNASSADGEHRVSRLDAAADNQRMPGRDPRTRQRSRFFGAQMRGHVNERGLLHHDRFGKHAIREGSQSAARPGVRDLARDPFGHEARRNAVAHFHAGYARARLDNGAQAIRTKRQREGQLLRVETLGHEQIAKVERHRRHANSHFAGS
jgi:beta-lactamase superfamily II metal-dependent hydrolase